MIKYEPNEEDFRPGRPSRVSSDQIRISNGYVTPAIAGDPHAYTTYDLRVKATTREWFIPEPLRDPPAPGDEIRFLDAVHFKYESGSIAGTKVVKTCMVPRNCDTQNLWRYFAMVDEKYDLLQKGFVRPSGALFPILRFVRNLAGVVTEVHKPQNTYEDLSEASNIDPRFQIATRRAQGRNYAGTWVSTVDTTLNGAGLPTSQRKRSGFQDSEEIITWDLQGRIKHLRQRLSSRYSSSGGGGGRPRGGGAGGSVLNLGPAPEVDEYYDWDITFEAPGQMEEEIKINDIDSEADEDETETTDPPS